MHLYHIHIKMNIPSLNNEDQPPRHHHHVTVITLLIQRAAVILAHHGADSMYNGLIFLRKNWQMSFHLLSVQFCNYAVLSHTKIFDSDWVVLAKNFINEVVIIMVVMAVDYPTMCGPCTNIKILLYSCNKNNVITFHLLFVLDCRWSHCHCDRCSPMNN